MASSCSPNSSPAPLPVSSVSYATPSSARRFPSSGSSRQAAFSVPDIRSQAQFFNASGWPIRSSWEMTARAGRSRAASSRGTPRRVVADAHALARHHGAEPSVPPSHSRASRTRS